MRTRNQGVSRLKKNPSGKYGSSRACEFGLGFSCACGFGLGFSCDGWASRSEVQFWVQRSQGVRGPSAQSLGSSCSHVRGVLGSCSIVGPWCSGAPLRDLRSKKQNSFKIPCWTIDCIQRICLWLQRSFSFRDDQTKSFCGNARKNPGGPSCTMLHP